jgi:hypothetical protein
MGYIYGLGGFIEPSKNLGGKYEPSEKFRGQKQTLFKFNLNTATVLFPQRFVRQPTQWINPLWTPQKNSRWFIESKVLFPILLPIFYLIYCLKNLN